MTNNPHHQDFAERLRRIDERRGESPPPPAPEKPKRVKPGQEDVRLRNGLIWACILAAAGAGGYYGFQAIPQDLKDMFAGVAAEVTPAPLPPAVETATMSNTGPTLASPAVLHAENEPLSIVEISEGYAAPTVDSSLGEIIPFARNAQCRLRRPVEGEKVYNVRVENALLPAPVQAFSDAEVAARILQNVRSVTQEGEAYDGGSTVSGQLSSLDVIVTDTSAPIYLALQNEGDGVIWNIQTAPDVTIAHVALIGTAVSGAALPSETTRVEGLLVSDFEGRETAEDCAVRPVRAPAPEWIHSIKAERGMTAAQASIAGYQQGHDRFNAWYLGVLGVDAGTNLVTARDAAHVVVGPVPDGTLSYQPLAGRTVHLMQTDHVLTGDSATRAGQTQALHDDLLTAAIGGTVAQLDLPPTESTGLPPSGVTDDAVEVAEVFRNNPVLRDAFSTDGLTNDRIVTVQAIVDQRTFSQEGEPQVPVDLIPLYATARAPAILQPHCADVVAELGTLCDLRGVEISTDISGKLLISGQLAFVPAASLGTVTTVENGEIYRTRVRMPYEGDLAPAYDAQSRQDMMARAQILCDSLRETFGNCVLSQLSFAVEELWITDLEALPAGTNPERFETEVEFTIYVDATSVSEERFVDTVNALVNPA